MHFSLSLPDGEQATSSFDEDPLEFVMGDGSLTEGLEHALYGLRAGERQTLRIDGDYAFGPRDEARIHRIPLAQFPADMAPQAGQIIAFQGADGEQTPGCVVALSETEAQVDFNHPMSGRELVFEVEILSVIAPPDEAGE